MRETTGSVSPGATQSVGPGLADEAIAAVVGFGDATVGGERLEPLVERGVADAAAGAQFGDRDWCGRLGENASDALVERDWLWWRCVILRIDELERERLT